LALPPNAVEHRNTVTARLISAFIKSPMATQTVQFSEVLASSTMGRANRNATTQSIRNNQINCLATSLSYSKFPHHFVFEIN
jgi:hypothetical protein